MAEHCWHETGNQLKITGSEQSVMAAHVVELAICCWCGQSNMGGEEIPMAGKHGRYLSGVPGQRRLVDRRGTVCAKRVEEA